MTYRRDYKCEIDDLTTESFEEPAAAEYRQENTQAQQLENSTTRQTVPSKKNFWQNVKLFDVSYSDEKFLALLISPFAICMNVAVCYIIVVQGWFIGL
jgi:hypothetical protein